MSQSLRYLLDDNVDIYEKQVLKKQLVSELVCLRMIHVSSLHLIL